MRSSDWRSDVCSSDLILARGSILGADHLQRHRLCRELHRDRARLAAADRQYPVDRFRQRDGPEPCRSLVACRNDARVIGELSVDRLAGRSEERRVGKEWVCKCRIRGAACYKKKKKI